MRPPESRAHQGLIWSRQRQVNTLRSMLREFYPAALVAFDDLAGRDALAVLAAAPSPEQGRRLTPARVVALLRRGGRQRNLQTAADQIVQVLRGEQLKARPAVVGAYAASTAALVAVITTVSAQVSVLASRWASLLAAGR